MDDFQNDCGAADVLRLEVDEGGGEPRRLVLPGPSAVIGSNPAAEVRLVHPQVSDRHALLQVLEGRLCAIDLDSRTGIAWPDGKAARHGTIDPGTSIGIGPFQVRLDGRTAIPTREGPDPFEGQLPEPTPALQLSRGPGSPQTWPLSESVTLIGRRPACQVRLADKSVSRVHAALIRTTAGIWVVDLLGREATTIGGVAIRRGRFEQGDVLSVGRYRFRLLRDIRDAASVSGLPAIARTSRAVALRTPAELVAYPATSAADEASSPVLMMLIEQMGRMQMQMLDQFQQAMRAMFEMMGERRREDTDRLREGDRQQEEIDQLREEVAQLRRLAADLEDLKGRYQAPGRLPVPSPAPVTPPPAAANAGPPAPKRPAAPEPETGPPGESIAWVCRRIAEIQGEQERRWGNVISLVKRNPGAK